MEMLLNLLLPECCISCGIIDHVVCKHCLSQIVEMNNREIYFDLVKKDFSAKPDSFQINSGIRIFSPFVYQGLVREIIKISKYSPSNFSALRLLSRLAIDKFETDIRIFFQGVNYLIPVPLSRRKLRTRGYNQARFIADTLVGRYPTLQMLSGLIRTHDTNSQYENTREARFSNLSDAFKVPNYLKSLLNKKVILLVDDICTSGATLSNAATVLLDAGVNEVRGFCLTRAVSEFAV